MVTLQIFEIQFSNNDLNTRTGKYLINQYGMFYDLECFKFHF